MGEEELVISLSKADCIGASAKADVEAVAGPRVGIAAAIGPYGVATPADMARFVRVEQRGVGNDVLELLERQDSSD
ncbi:hypothetical protein [Sandarakinorhabdus sp.]|uniref:hypothetical protein n=1 Tax=Sandarakinorhabdus sp. TaxID=1916663 RepID=UPI003569352E